MQWNIKKNAETPIRNFLGQLFSILISETKHWLDLLWVKMEKQLKCIPKLLSLKEMALRRVAVSFWSDPDIISCPISDFIEEWKIRFDDPIKEKVKKLLIPEPLKEQLTDLIRPISIEVIHWRKLHPEFLISVRKIDASVAAKIPVCWTTAGSIDYRKSAEEIVRCDEIDIATRYEIACNYCLENYISLFWNELSEGKKKKYENNPTNFPILPYCWPHILQGKYSELDFLWRTSAGNLTSFDQIAFEFCVILRLKTAAKYFFQKLTHDEKEISLMRSFETLFLKCDRQAFLTEKISEVLLFLLSVMSFEQQVEAIKAHPSAIIYYFLQWPLQDLFLDNANLIWSCIPSSSYMALIEKIIVGYHASSFHFPIMFEAFMMQCPQQFKKCFIEEKLDRFGEDIRKYFARHFHRETAADHFLFEFFRKKDSRSIKVMFRALDASDRAKIVSQENVVLLLRDYITPETCELVELSLREATLPKEVKQRLKAHFVPQLEFRKCFIGEDKSFEKKCETLFNFLDETDAGSGELKRGKKRKRGKKKKGGKKRKIEDGSRKKIDPKYFLNLFESYRDHLPPHGWKWRN